MKFVWASPLLIDKLWPTLAGPIEKAAARGFFTPETLKASLKSGDTQLVLADHDNKYAGFIVLKSEENNLHIWVLHSLEGLSAHAEVADMARQAGFTSISFTSGQPGFSRISKRLGFEPIATIYSKEL